MNDVYTVLGSNVLKSIPEKFESAELHIEAYLNQYVNYDGFYITKGNEKYLDMDKFDYPEMSKNIFTLLSDMSENHKWNRAVFKIWADGKFDMQFEWNGERDTERNNNLADYEKANDNA